MQFDIRSFFGSFIALLFPVTSFALEGNFSVEHGMVGATRAHSDSVGTVRTSPAMMSLVPRYQIEGAGYVFRNLDWGMGIGAFDSTQGPLSLGFMYLRENSQADLDPNYLPAWRLPDDEIQEYSIVSLVGASTALGFGNRSISIGFGAFYRGNQSDIGRTVHGFEFNPSIAFKFADQIALVNGMVDSLDMQKERAYEGGLRWGLLEPIAFRTPWVQCSPLIGKGVYRSPGGVEVDWSVSMPTEDDAQFSSVSAGLDFPLSCQLLVRGGYEWDFVAQQYRYGMGMSLDNIKVSLNYDIEITPYEAFTDHRHVIALRIRLAPWKFRRMERR